MITLALVIPEMTPSRSPSPLTVKVNCRLLIITSIKVQKSKLKIQLLKYLVQIYSKLLLNKYLNNFSV